MRGGCDAVVVVRCISMGQRGSWAKRKEIAFAGCSGLQRPPIDYKPRSKPDCCSKFGAVFLPFVFLGGSSSCLDFALWPLIVQKTRSNIF